MLDDRAFKVRWIVAPSDPEAVGLYGTTTHAGQTPAGAALASAERLMRAISEENWSAAIHILSVSEDEEGPNLLSGDALRLALHHHPKELPVEVLYRPLC
jgi:hypothetical protein